MSSPGTSLPAAHGPAGVPTAMRRCCAVPNAEYPDEGGVQAPAAVAESVLTTEWYTFRGVASGPVPVEGRIEFHGSPRLLRFEGKVARLDKDAGVSGVGSLVVAQGQNQVELKGTIENGELEGDGCEIDERDCRMQGQFSKGVPHGMVAVTNKQTGDVETGRYESGALVQKVSIQRGSTLVRFESGPDADGVCCGTLTSGGVAIDVDLDRDGNVLGQRTREAPGHESDGNIAMEFAVSPASQGRARAGRKHEDADDAREASPRGDDGLIILSVKLPSK